jgi:hypothetical protein
MTARQAEAPTTTRTLLALGAAAGPLYVIVGLAQILTREGFDWTRHALSLMSNGAWGWVQVAIGAAFFSADPALGFPPGTSDGPPAVITTHGLLHFVSGGIGFLGLIAACFVLAARFRGEDRSSWMWFSVATGVLFFAGFAGIASGAQSRTLVVAFYLAVLLAWTWLSALFRAALVRAER